jgi:hypothetical protein
MLDGYVKPSSGAQSIRFQTDLRVVARATLTRVLWLLGLPDQAKGSTQRALEEGAEAGPIWLFSAMALAEFPIALLDGDLATAERSVTAMLDHASRGLGPWAATSRAFEGALSIARGDTDSGIGVLRSAIEEMSRESQPVDMLLLASLSDAIGQAGEVDEGLTIVDGALDRAERKDEHWCTPELLRVKASLLAARGNDDAGSVLLAAIDLARRQEALAWELRCATQLAVASHAEGRGAEARDLLVGVRGRFRGGLETADLVRADRLLEDWA